MGECKGKNVPIRTGGNGGVLVVKEGLEDELRKGKGMMMRVRGIYRQLNNIYFFNYLVI